MSSKMSAVFLLFYLFSNILQNVQSQTVCPKHQILLHNMRPKYYIDKGEQTELWTKIIPNPWQDNRLIGGVSNPSLLSFNLTSIVETSAFKGVITRNMTSVITRLATESSNSLPSSNHSYESEFFIRAFSEDSSCDSVQVATNISIGCPPDRHIRPRGKTFIGCDNLGDTVEQANSSSFQSAVQYDHQTYGCPENVRMDKQYRPQLDLYDNDQFVREVTANIVMIEKSGKTSYEYNLTMKEAGCVRRAQTWHQMSNDSLISFAQGWTKENYKSCFERDIADDGQGGLDDPYEIMNSTGGSYLTWLQSGMYVFKVKVIDPDFSFCDLSTEFALYVQPPRPAVEVIPTFLVLGCSSTAILVVLVITFNILEYCIECT